MLSELLDGAVLTGASVSDLKEFKGSLSLRYDLIVQGYAQRTGDLLLFCSSALGRKSRHVLEEIPRQEPIVFSHTASESDVIDISLPADYTVDEMPQAVKYSYSFATYKAETRVEQHSLHYSRTYELKDVRVPVEQQADLEKLFRDISDDERAYTIMKVP
jgi:hypothetical protein